MEGSTVYGILNSKIKGLASGYDHATKTGDNTFDIYFKDGSHVSLTIPQPELDEEAIKEQIEGLTDETVTDWLEENKDNIKGEDGKTVQVLESEDEPINDEAVLIFDPNELVKNSDYYTKLQSDVKYAKDIDVGDISKFPVKVDNIVDALILMQGGFMKNFTYADKNIIIDYRNGTKFVYDVSPIITDASIGEFKDVNLTGIKDGESLVYSSARKTFVGKAIDSSAMLEEAKTYADDLVKKINKAPSMVVDEKPTYDESTHTTTYKKNGETHTTTDSTNFYYKVDGNAWTTIWIDDIEFSSALHGTVDFSEYISRETDLTDTIETVNLSLIPTMKAVKELIEFAQEGLGDKVNTADIVDSLTSSDATRPLSANQGRVLHDLVTGVSGKIVYADTEDTDEAKAIAELPTAEKVKADYVSKDMVVDDLGFGDDETTTYALTDDDAIPTVKALKSLHTLLFEKFMQIKNIIKKDDTETVASDDNVYSASKTDDLLSKKLRGSVIQKVFLDTLVGTSGTPSDFANALRNFYGITTGYFYGVSNNETKQLYYDYGIIPTTGNYYMEVNVISSTKNFYIRATKQGDSAVYSRVIHDGVAQEWQKFATVDQIADLADGKITRERVIYIVNESGRWVSSAYGADVFDENTTIADIVNHLNTAKVKAGKVVIYSNSNTNKFNESLPAMGGGMTVIQGNYYENSNGAWVRCSLTFTPFGKSVLYVNTCKDGVLGGWQELATMEYVNANCLTKSGYTTIASNTSKTFTFTNGSSCELHCTGGQAQLLSDIITVYCTSSGAINYVSFRGATDIEITASGNKLTLKNKNTGNSLVVTPIKLLGNLPTT